MSEDKLELPGDRLILQGHAAQVLEHARRVYSWTKGLGPARVRKNELAWILDDVERAGNALREIVEEIEDPLCLYR